MSETKLANAYPTSRPRIACCFRGPSRRAAALAVVLAGLILADGIVAGAQGAEQPASAQKAQAAKKAGKAKKPAKKQDPFAWKSMFDGKSLKGWKIPQFGGEGEVKVKDGAIVLGMGVDMTGITWKGEFPKTNYEVTLEGKRTQGIDFFATTTFPVGENHVSLVVGGWAGTVVGISCVDYYDASDNITTQFKSFKDNQWYKIRIRVSDPKIECWIDDDKMVDLARQGHKFDIRMEVDLCRPFGISTWMTEGVVRNIRVRRLKPEEVAAIKKETKDQS